MRNAKSLELRRPFDDDVDEQERDAEVTGVHPRSNDDEQPEGQSVAFFEGVELRLQNGREGRHRLGLDLDLKLKGSKPENDQDDGTELEDEEPELGIEEDEASAEDEDEASAEAEDEDEPEDSQVEEDEDEDVEAREQSEDELSFEDEEDDDAEASAEDEDQDEDEDEGQDQVEDEDEEELEARDEDDEDDEDDENEDSHHTEEEKRAALRSAGDGGAVGSALRTSVEAEPRPAKKSQADKVIAIAKKQVGVREGKNNYTKFAAELIKDKIAQRWWQNQPWCQTFQAWAFVEAGLRKLAPMTPGCATAIAWFRTRKRVNQYPAIGAQVFFGPGGGEHVGLVYRYDPTHIWTIEGNTNDKGSAEGIGVFLKKRTRKSAFGYGYPKFAEGIVTADPRKKGKAGFTFAKTASSGAKDTASEPDTEEKALPWVSVKQVQWAATHSESAERAAKAGAANPRDDVKLVQEALEKVLGASTTDPEGIYDDATERLFNRFRREKLKFTGAGASAKPGPKALSALGRRSKLFRVRTGSMTAVDEKSGSTTPAKISARDVTFKRFTTSSSSENISKWIRLACRKAGATPSSAWVKGYKTIIKRESSGNPNACNVWDSNAKTPPGFRKVKDYGDGYTKQGRIKLNGKPTHFQCSRGIVQCIPQTFAHHHARGTSRNIYDPVASIAASMRYVLSRYDVAKNGANLARKVQQADPTRPPKGY